MNDDNLNTIKGRSMAWGILWHETLFDISNEEFEKCNELSEKYCETCSFDFTCCIGCAELVKSRKCEDKPDVCLSFFCPFIVEKMDPSDKTFVSQLWKKAKKFGWSEL